MANPMGTGAAYCTPKKNGTSTTAGGGTTPTRYVDPETPMDPAEYGGGAMAQGVELGLMVLGVGFGLMVLA